MNAISAERLTKRFEDHRVLMGLALEVPQGAIYGLLGRNGAGKTTLLRLVMGLLVPTSGEALVLGKNLVTASGTDKAPVGYVGDKSILPTWMEVGDLLRFEATLRSDFKPERLEAYLKREQITSIRDLSSLSKGQLRRVDLEIALAGNPKVLVLDEPFDGLDPVSRAEAMEALIAHASANGCTILISSHVLGDLERLCDRIGVLAGGRIAFESELDTLKESAALVFVGGEAQELSVRTEVIGKRSDERGTTWLVRGLDADQEEHLKENGFHLTRPGLDELGAELLRCLDPV